MTKTKSLKAGTFRYLILFLSIIFIIIGIFRVETQIVLSKAINVCLECIGIG